MRKRTGIVSPCWSPDGQRLAFATIVEPARTHNGKAKGQEDIWVIGADGANRRRLTDGNSTNLTPFWAVDNRVYFISDHSIDLSHQGRELAGPRRQRAESRAGRGHQQCRGGAMAHDIADGEEPASAGAAMGTEFEKIVIVPTGGVAVMAASDDRMARAST